MRAFCFVSSLSFLPGYAYNDHLSCYAMLCCKCDYILCVTSAELKLFELNFHASKIARKADTKSSTENESEHKNCADRTKVQSSTLMLVVRHESQMWTEFHFLDDFNHVTVT